MERIRAVAGNSGHRTSGRQGKHEDVPLITVGQNSSNSSPELRRSFPLPALTTIPPLAMVQGILISSS